MKFYFVLFGLFLVLCNGMERNEIQKKEKIKHISTKIYLPTKEMYTKYLNLIPPRFPPTYIHTRLRVPYEGKSPNIRKNSFGGKSIKYISGTNNTAAWRTSTEPHEPIGTNVQGKGAPIINPALRKIVLKPKNVIPQTYQVIRQTDVHRTTPTRLIQYVPIRQIPIYTTTFQPVRPKSVNLFQPDRPLMPGGSAKVTTESYIFHDNSFEEFQTTTPAIFVPVPNRNEISKQPTKLFVEIPTVPPPHNIGRIPSHIGPIVTPHPIPTEKRLNPVLVKTTLHPQTHGTPLKPTTLRPQAPKALQHRKQNYIYIPTTSKPVSVRTTLPPEAPRTTQQPIKQNYIYIPTTTKPVFVRTTLRPEAPRTTLQPRKQNYIYIPTTKPVSVRTTLRQEAPRTLKPRKQNHIYIPTTMKPVFVRTTLRPEAPRTLKPRKHNDIYIPTTTKPVSVRTTFRPEASRTTLYPRQQIKTPRPTTRHQPFSPIVFIRPKPKPKPTNPPLVQTTLPPIIVPPVISALFEEAPLPPVLINRDIQRQRILKNTPPTPINVPTTPNSVQTTDSLFRTSIETMEKSTSKYFTRDRFTSFQLNSVLPNVTKSMLISSTGSTINKVTTTERPARRHLDLKTTTTPHMLPNVTDKSFITKTVTMGTLPLTETSVPIAMPTKRVVTTTGRPPTVSNVPKNNGIFIDFIVQPDKTTNFKVVSYISEQTGTTIGHVIPHDLKTGTNRMESFTTNNIKTSNQLTTTPYTKAATGTANQQLATTAYTNPETSTIGVIKTPEVYISSTESASVNYSFPVTTITTPPLSGTPARQIDNNIVGNRVTDTTTSNQPEKSHLGSEYKAVKNTQSPQGDIFPTTTDTYEIKHSLIVTGIPLYLDLVADRLTPTTPAINGIFVHIPETTFEPKSLTAQEKETSTTEAKTSEPAHTTNTLKSANDSVKISTAAMSKYFPIYFELTTQLALSTTTKKTMDLTSERNPDTTTILNKLLPLSKSSIPFLESAEKETISNVLTTVYTSLSTTETTKTDSTIKDSTTATNKPRDEFKSKNITITSADILTSSTTTELTSTATLTTSRKPGPGIAVDSFTPSPVAATKIESNESTLPDTTKTTHPQSDITTTDSIPPINITAHTSTIAATTMLPDTVSLTSSVPDIATSGITVPFLTTSAGTPPYITSLASTPPDITTTATTPRDITTTADIQPNIKTAANTPPDITTAANTPPDITTAANTPPDITTAANTPPDITTNGNTPSDISTTASTPPDITTTATTPRAITTTADIQPNIKTAANTPPDITTAANTPPDITTASNTPPDIIKTDSTPSDITTTASTPPDITTNDTTQPDITTTDTTLPDITTTDTTPPDITTTDTTPPDITTTDTTPTAVTTTSSTPQDITTTASTPQDITTASNTLPDITTSAGTTPAITTSAGTTPAITTSAGTTPDITTTANTPPDFNTTANTTADITTTSGTPPYITTTANTPADITSTAGTTPAITTSVGTTPDITTTANTPPDFTTTAITTEDITTTSGTPPDITKSASTAPDISTYAKMPPVIPKTANTPPDITTTSSTPPDITKTANTPPDITTTASTPPDITTSANILPDIAISANTSPDITTSTSTLPEITSTSTIANITDKLQNTTSKSSLLDIKSTSILPDILSTAYILPNITTSASVQPEITTTASTLPDNITANSTLPEISTNHTLTTVVTTDTLIDTTSTTSLLPDIITSASTLFNITTTVGRLPKITKSTSSPYISRILTDITTAHASTIAATSALPGTPTMKSLLTVIATTASTRPDITTTRSTSPDITTTSSTPKDITTIHTSTKTNTLLDTTTVTSRLTDIISTVRTPLDINTTSPNSIQTYTSTIADTANTLADTTTIGRLTITTNDSTTQYGTVYAITTLNVNTTHTSMINGSSSTVPNTTTASTLTDMTTIASMPPDFTTTDRTGQDITTAGALLDKTSTAASTTGVNQSTDKVVTTNINVSSIKSTFKTTSTTPSTAGVTSFINKPNTTESSTRKGPQSCITMGCPNGRQCVTKNSVLCLTPTEHKDCQCMPGCRLENMYVALGEPVVIDSCGNLCYCSTEGLTACTKLPCSRNKYDITTPSLFKAVEFKPDIKDRGPTRGDAPYFYEEQTNSKSSIKVHGLHFPEQTLAWLSPFSSEFRDHLPSEGIKEISLEDLF